MKVSEPFAGYSLAKGHLVFHVAFFVASFFVYEPPILEEEIQAGPTATITANMIDIAEQFKTGFLMIRWIHFTVAILSILSDYLGRQKGDDMKRAYTKSGLVLFSRALEVLQVVLYQSAIFYVQFIFGTSSLDGSITTSLPGATGEVKSWLLIEIIGFYMIIVGAIVFLLLETCTSIFNENTPKESERKDRDIIKYSVRTIEWQGFNYLLIFSPALLLWKEHELPLETHTVGAVSWTPLMITTISVSLLQFLVLRKIIVLKKRVQSSFANVNDSESAVDELETESFVYEKRFDNSKWWILFLSGISQIAVGTYALKTEPIQVYYKLWIPVSFFVYWGMICYYIVHYFSDKSQQKAQKETFDELRKGLKSGLANIISSQNRDTKEIVEKPAIKNPEMKLGGDTYAMAFKAMNTQACKQLNVKDIDWYGAFHGACFVFAIQLLMITFVLSVIFSPGFHVLFPTNVYTLGARFVCTILMHLQVEADTRQGISMLKYTVNHWESFRNPKIAFTIGFMQMTGGISTELCCMVYLASINNTIDTVIKFIALGNIAKVDDFYAGALSGDYVLKGKVYMEITNHRKDFSDSNNEKKRTWVQWIFRGIYKHSRMQYTCFMYYFMPFMTLLIPYLLS